MVSESNGRTGDLRLCDAFLDVLRPKRTERGCLYNTWADKFLTSQPAEKDVIGTYAIDADSQAEPAMQG